jgi:hypothetical protein
MKVFSCLFAINGLFALYGFIHYLYQVEYPPRMLAPYIGPNSIIHSTDDQIWGWPTDIQYHALTSLKMLFYCLGYAAYLYFFKSSHSKWLVKLGKVALALLLAIFYSSATQIMYFEDIYHPILFVVIAGIIFNRKKPSYKAETIIDLRHKTYNSTETTLCENSGNEESSSSSSPSNEHKTMYCKHCGKLIADGSSYCSYCGASQGNS